MEWLTSVLVSELFGLVYYGLGLAGLVAAHMLPDAEGRARAVCVLILLSLLSLSITAYALGGLIVPLCMCAVIAAVMLVEEFL